MELNIPLTGGLALRITDSHEDGKSYPTGILQKGLLLLDAGQSLAEEGVGFGVPILKRGLQTIFPGALRLSCSQDDSTWSITAVYSLNRVERIARDGRGNVENTLLYAIKNSLATAMLHSRLLRAPLSAASGMLRRMFHWETTYAEAGFCIEVNMRYTIPAQTGRVLVEMETGDLPPDISEVIVMNELGARTFDRFRDGAGSTLQGDEISLWEAVRGGDSRFESRGRRVAFQVDEVPGARLYRGRERTGDRLSWAGYGYSLPPSTRKFRYGIRIERLA